MREDLKTLFFNRLGLKISFDIIDDLVTSDNNILRPIVGHSFEFIVAEIITNKLGGKVEDVGGDSDIDLIIIDKNNNRYTAQIKTLNKSTIKKNRSFGVNLHKTHGLERRPNNLYPTVWPCPTCNHDGDEFPEFLIIPHPNKGVLIIPKSEIPENKSYPGHFADPAIFEWESEWLNRWDLLGFPEYKGLQLEREKIEKQDVLTKVCEIVNLTAEELLLLWLKPENFRMIDMNLRGNLREPAMKKFLEDKNLPTKFPKEKYPKFDLICNNIKIQVKGPSKSLSNPNLMTIGVEVMGSHGKGAIRRYSETDFDYLGIVIDPQYIPEQLGLDLDNYHFCFVPTKDLPLHYRNNYEWETNDKLYDVAKFLFKKIDDKVYLIPNNAYQAPRKFKDDNGNIIERQPVSFRNNSIYEINCIPEEFKKQ